MADVDQLIAEAEQAEIRGEMARSRSLLAKASLHEHEVSWSSIKARLLIASRAAAARRGVSEATSPAGSTVGRSSGG